MKTALTAVVICAVLGGVARSSPPAASDEATIMGGPTPLIVEKNEGEGRAWRPIEGAAGWNAQPGPFVFKVDRHNGGSSHLVFITEDVPPGGTIDRHRHLVQTRLYFCRTGLHG